MQQFNIRENTFEEIKKKALVRMIITMALVIIAAVTITYVNSTHTKDEVNVWPFVAPLLVITFGYGIYSGTKKLKKILGSYSLTVTNDRITREQFNLAPLSISAIELKEIIKSKDGRYTIKGLTPTDIIYVPKYIDKAGELELLLNAMHPITINTKKTLLERYGIVLLFAVLASLLGVYAATNKIIVAVSGTFLVGFFIYSIYETQRSKNVEPGVKRRMWIMLIVLLSVIGVMISKLIGPGVFLNQPQ